MSITKQKKEVKAMKMVTDGTYTLGELNEFLSKDPTFKGYDRIFTCPEGAVIEW